MNSLAILILAAGKGTRMKSTLPKVLHPVGGVPMVDLICRAAHELKPSQLALIVGHQAEQVREHVKQCYPKASFYTQRTLNGSGGAVRQALAWVKKQKGEILVTCGDMPLLQASTLRDLFRAHLQNKNIGTVLTAKVPNAFGYGRIVRRPDGSVEKIVEELDATPEERELNEINTGTYVFNARALAKVLPKLKNNNAKREFYLTDVIGLLQDAGQVGASIVSDSNEAQGINSRADLAMAETAIRMRKVRQLMDRGVTVLDPQTTYISQEVTIEPDTIIWPQTHLLGETHIGSGCQIGPWAYLNNTIIENNVIFRASFSDRSVIRKGAKVGPFSHIRPNSDLGPDVHMGNFSEVKNAKVGAGSKVNHLSYLGDAKIGKNVNIGAGTITCNYDGTHKHPTQIQDSAFIGSNTNLIAPITVGAHAVIGAGSSLSENVPAWSLVFERAKAVVKKNWAKKKFKKKK